VVCDARAGCCTDWNAHCSTSKQGYEVLVQANADRAVVIPVLVEDGKLHEKQAQVIVDLEEPVKVEGQVVHTQEEGTGHESQE